MIVFSIIITTCTVLALVLSIVTFTFQRKKNRTHETAELKNANTEEWQAIVQAQGAWIATLQAEVNGLKDRLLNCEREKLAVREAMRELEKKFDAYVREKERA